MPVHRNHAKKECARLMNTCPVLSSKDANAATEMAREITDTLTASCQGDEHASATVSAFLSSTRDWKNIIAELVAAAGHTAPAKQGEQPPAGCGECSLGSDPTTGEDRWAPHVTRTSRLGYDYSGRCKCPRGRWLAARDSERSQIAPVSQSHPARVTKSDFHGGDAA